MSTQYIKTKIDHLGSAWEEFKKTNDMRLRDIERKGATDPLVTEKIGRMNHVLDEYKSRLDSMETAMVRPELGGHATQVSGIAYAEHKQAFCNYIRRGVEDGLAYLERKALSVASDSDGGYLVTPTVSQNITRTVFETSPMRQLASVEVISSDSLEMIEDRADATVGWTSETGAISETTSPDLGKKIIPVHELYAQPKATQKLIDDASVDIEQWLASKLADAFSRKENTAFISGDGVGKPRGITTYADGTGWGQIQQIASGTTGEVTADGLIKVFYALKEEYMTHATFMMNRASVQAARLLKEATTNQYLWQPGLTAGAPDTLMGVPVMMAADMATPSSGSLSVAVGDFKRAYQIVDRTGIRILRDPFTEKPFVKFYCTKRTGGDVVNFEAVKLLRLS